MHRISKFNFGFLKLFRVSTRKKSEVYSTFKTRPKKPDAIECPTRPDLTRSGRVRSGFLFGSGTRFPTLIHGKAIYVVGIYMIIVCNYPSINGPGKWKKKTSFLPQLLACTETKD